MEIQSGAGKGGALAVQRGDRRRLAKLPNQSKNSSCTETSITLCRVIGLKKFLVPRARNSLNI